MKRRVQRLEEEREQTTLASRLRNQPRVQEAIRDTYTWVTQYTRTYNEHWQEEGRPSPYEPFPNASVYPHIPYLFAFIDSERIALIEKSRDMMMSWGCVAYFTRHAMTVPQRGVLFQTQTKAKVIQLVNYAKCLYEQQPNWLKAAFPLAKPMKQQSALCLQFAHGGYIRGLPGGANQIRSFHPWGYLNDETAFQPYAGECYNEALSVVRGKIVFNSSAGPGWYADFKNDIVRSEES
jgi:hypothetical protein